MSREVPRQQAPGIYRKQIGDVILTTLVDGSETFSFDIFSQSISTEDARGLLVAANLPPTPSMPVNAYLLQSEAQTILIDTGDANCMGSGGRLQEALAAAQVEASDIDAVLLTHAHPDHVGGLVDLTGSRLFPNAELILHIDELRFWQDAQNFVGAPHLNEVRSLACKVFDAYQTSIRTATDGEVRPGIALQHLPGHTPGHSGYWIESGEHRALIWGDIVHWPDIQIPRPDVTLTFDFNPAQMVQTRKLLLQQVTDNRILVGGMHLNFPGFIRVHRNDGGYQVQEERWLPDMLPVL